MSVKIFRYIAKDILITTPVIMAVLLIIILVARFLYFLNQAAMGIITLSAVYKIIGILVSLFLVHILLISFYLAIIFCIGRLFVEYEMTVLQACGFSRLQLVKMLMGVASIVFMIAIVLVLWVEPYARTSQTRIFDAAVASVSLSKILPRRFQTLDHGNKMVYVDNVSKSNPRTLYGMTVIQRTAPTSSQPEQWDVSEAHTASEQWIPNQSMPFIVMKQGQRLMFSIGKKNTKRTSFSTYGLRIGANTNKKAPPAEGLPTHILWKYKDTNAYYLSVLYYRFMIIFSVFLLPLLALPFSHVGPRKGRYLMLIPAFVIYLLYMNFILTTKEWIGNAVANKYFLILWLPCTMAVIITLLILFGLGYPRGLTWIRSLAQAKKIAKQLKRT